MQQQEHHKPQEQQNQGWGLRRQLLPGRPILGAVLVVLAVSLLMQLTR
jgi:hypothetical protein